MMFEGEKFSLNLKNIAKQTGEAIVEMLVTKGITKVADAMSKLVFGSGKEGDKGLLGNLKGGLFGGKDEDGSGGVVGTGTSVVKDVAKSALKSVVSGGMAGDIIGGAIAGIGAYAGSMRLEGTMNAVEKNTRFTEIQVRDLMDNHLNWIVNYQKIMTQQLGSDGVNGWLESIDQQVRRIVPAATTAPAAAPQVTVNYAVEVNNPTGSTSDMITQLKQALTYNTDDLTAAIIRALNNQAQGQVAYG